jgi:cell division protein FtsB
MGMGVWLAVAVAAAAFFTAFLDGESGLRTWWELRADLRSAEDRIAQLQTSVDSLERDSGGLEADPFALERAIRERLQYARPGETVVLLTKSAPANTRIP